MDCSPPGSSIHGIFQARVLEWVACESKSLDIGLCKVLQNDFVNENISKQGLNEEKSQIHQIREGDSRELQRVKLVKMYHSKNDLSQLQLLIRKQRHCS